MATEYVRIKKSASPYGGRKLKVHRWLNDFTAVEVYRPSNHGHHDVIVYRNVEVTVLPPSQEYVEGKADGHTAGFREGVQHMRVQVLQAMNENVSWEPLTRALMKVLQDSDKLVKGGK